MSPRRPSFPASSSEFALPGPPHSHASPSLSSAIAFPGPPPSPLSTDPNPNANEEPSPFILRFRRPSLLAPARLGAESRHSPLTSSSFTFPLSRRYSTSIRDVETEAETTEESESDRDNFKMYTDSPPDADSGPTTPALTDPSTSTLSVDSDSSMKTGRARSPSTPPPTSRHTPKSSIDGMPEAPPSLAKLRRLSQPIKMPRILTLLAESRPEENELKSEAQFQRLVASVSGLPLSPRTPRAASDRGRYPEEADTEEPYREDTPSDDEDDGSQFAYTPSEPISIIKPVTPAHSVNGDDISESPGAAMDIDFPSSFGSPNMSSWRYTPPPTSYAVRTNKRKFDDRYDPYPNASKRRAVSPSLSYLRESQPSLFNPRTPTSSRHPMPMPIAIPNGLNSGASSPIIPPSNGNGRPLSFGSASAMSSPILRAQIGLASPILRPMRARREGEWREVDGAGEAVHSLSLVE